MNYNIEKIITIISNLILVCDDSETRNSLLELSAIVVGNSKKPTKIIKSNFDTFDKQMQITLKNMVDNLKNEVTEVTNEVVTEVINEVDKPQDFVVETTNDNVEDVQDSPVEEITKDTSDTEIVAENMETMENVQDILVKEVNNTEVLENNNDTVDTFFDNTKDIVINNSETVLETTITETIVTNEDTTQNNINISKPNTEDVSVEVEDNANDNVISGVKLMGDGKNLGTNDKTYIQTLLSAGINDIKQMETTKEEIQPSRDNLYDYTSVPDSAIKVGVPFEEDQETEEMVTKPVETKLEKPKIEIFDDIDDVDFEEQPVINEDNSNEKLNHLTKLSRHMSFHSSCYNNVSNKTKKLEEIGYYCNEIDYVIFPTWEFSSVISDLESTNFIEYINSKEKSHYERLLDKLGNSSAMDLNTFGEFVSFPSGGNFNTTDKNIEEREQNIINHFIKYYDEVVNNSKVQLIFNAISPNNTSQEYSKKLDRYVVAIPSLISQLKLILNTKEYCNFFFGVDKLVDKNIFVIFDDSKICKNKDLTPSQNSISIDSYKKVFLYFIIRTLAFDYEKE